MDGVAVDVVQDREHVLIRVDGLGEESTTDQSTVALSADIEPS